MLRSSIVSALLLSLLVHTWAATATAQPILEVTASSNPIVGGIVQLSPGDQDVSITFGIVPDSGVQSFDLVFESTSSQVTVDDCSGNASAPATVAFCPIPIVLDILGISNLGDAYDPAVTAPFDIAQATVSVNTSVAPGNELRTVAGSFIDDGTVEPITGQVVATVVPEPGTALLLGLGLAGLAALRRREDSA